MAEQQGTRWVLINMIHGAVERTEDQIRELKSGGLFTREASGPDDSHDASPKADAVPASAPQATAPPAVPAKPAA